MDSVKLLVANTSGPPGAGAGWACIVAWLVCGVGWVGVYAIPNQFDPVLACSSMPTPC